MRIFAVAVALIGIAITSVVTIALFVIFTPDRRPLHGTQAALLAAMPTIAADELRARGHRLAGPLLCQGVPGQVKHRPQVSCSGMTTGNKPVRVIGATESNMRREYFTILVNGLPLVQNVDCLGADCRRAKD